MAPFGIGSYGFDNAYSVMPGAVMGTGATAGADPAADDSFALRVAEKNGFADIAKLLKEAIEKKK